MTTTIDSTALFFGAPASLTVGGVENGATITAPKATVEATLYAPDFQGAVGPISGAVFVTKIKAAVEFDVNELTAAKIARAVPGSTSVVGTGATSVNGHSQTLAADSAAGATVIKFPTGVALATSAAADDIIDTATAHGFTAGQRVMFESKTGGTGLSTLTPYYVIAANLAAQTLQVSLTAGGAAIDFSTDITAGVLIPAYTVGEFLKIGDVGETEIRAIATVGTSGSGGTGLAISTPLVRAHDTGDAILQVVDAGTTITTWRTGRVPSSAFADVILDGVGVDGRHLKVTVTDALGDGKLEIEMSDSAVAGSHVVMTGYANGADPTLCPVSIEVG